MNKSNYIVIALGGSLIVPDGIDVAFLKKFRKLLLQETKRGRRFVLVAGGGKTARTYANAASQIVKASHSDLDWIGIDATKLNARLLQIIFQNRIEVAPGWKPGWSTDYVAVRLARKIGAREIIIAGDTDFVYDRDPKKFRDAKTIRELTWSEYRKLIPKKWKPGLSTPVDPVAARLAKRNGLTAKIIKGTDLSNFRKAIEGKSFRGTVLL